MINFFIKNMPKNRSCERVSGGCVYKWKTKISTYKPSRGGSWCPRRRGSPSGWRGPGRASGRLGHPHSEKVRSVTLVTTRTRHYQGCPRVWSRGHRVRRHPCKLKNLAIFYNAKKSSIVFTNGKRADRISPPPSTWFFKLHNIKKGWTNIY